MGAFEPQPPPHATPAPPPDPAAAVTPAPQVRDAVLWTHLSALIGLIGIPSALGPLVVWLTQREKGPFVDDQGKEALNFNLSALIYAVALGVFGIVFSLATLGLGFFLLIPVFFALFVAWLVIVIVASVRASKGEPYRYPLTIRFLR